MTQNPKTLEAIFDEFYVRVKEFLEAQRPQEGCPAYTKTGLEETPIGLRVDTNMIRPQRKNQGKKGGKNSGVKRKEEAEAGYEKIARTLAQSTWNDDPSLSIPELSDEIEEQWPELSDEIAAQWPKYPVPRCRPSMLPKLIPQWVRAGTLIRPPKK